MKKKFKQPNQLLKIKEWNEVLEGRTLQLEFGQSLVRSTSKAWRCSQGRKVFRPSTRDRSCIQLLKTKAWREDEQKQTLVTLSVIVMTRPKCNVMSLRHPFKNLVNKLEDHYAHPY